MKKVINAIKKPFKWYFKKYSKLYEKGYIDPKYIWP